MLVGRIWFLIGCWTQGLFSLLAVAIVTLDFLPCGPLQLGYLLYQNLPFEEKIELVSSKMEVILSNLITKVTSHLLCHILLTRSKPQVFHTSKAGVTQESETQDTGIIVGPPYNQPAIVINGDFVGCWSYLCIPISLWSILCIKKKKNHNFIS